MFSFMERGFFLKIKDKFIDKFLVAEGFKVIGVKKMLDT